MNDKSHELSKNSTGDYVAATLKSALGMIPFAGPFLSELAGSIIPNQKVDRIVKFAEQLELRLKSLEKRELLINAIQDEIFTDLVEEGMVQASKSLSDERREYLASLISNSISSNDIEYHESKHLMRILGELSDVEVIWLRHFISEGYSYGTDMVFREKHQNILEQAVNASQEGRQELSALVGSYKEHLTSLGLLEKKMSIKESRNGSEISTEGYTITMLGRILLKEIGLIPDLYYHG